MKDFLKSSVFKGGTFILIAASCSLLTAPQASAVMTSGTSNYSDTQVKKHASDRYRVLSFDKGQVALSASKQMELQDLISKVGVDNIDRVELAVWSDKPFAKTAGSLTKTDENLADNRIDNIKNFLEQKDVSSLDIKAFNMGETSNWLARLFQTDEAELKSAFSKNVGPEMSRADFNYIQSEGGPGKVVVVVVQK